MNVKLLRQVKRAILKEPVRFDMRNWVTLNDPVAPCHTTACIAGWVDLLDAQSNYGFTWVEAALDADMFVESRAQKLLGLTERQTARLFHDSSWPRKFSEAQRFLYSRFHVTQSVRGRRTIRREMAKLAARRIEHFIKTKGRE